MTIDDINKLIEGDEHRKLELKKSTGELKDGMQSACAFLNTEGGWLIFGITPNSLKVVGQLVTDNTQREISQALAGLEPQADGVSVIITFMKPSQKPSQKASQKMIGNPDATC